VPLLLAALAAGLVLRATPSSDLSEQFQLPGLLLENALVSCNDIEVKGGAEVDALGVNSGAEDAGRGHILANGDIRLNGNVEVDGDVTAGPGRRVRINGQPQVGGEVGYADEVFDCYPIDLAALYVELDASNDNGMIPATDKGKSPLGGADGRELTLKANDGLSLPAGTYLLSSLTVQSNSVLRIEGRVNILVTGEIKVTGGGKVNPEGNPFNLRLWSSHDGRVQIDSRTVVQAFVYAPDAEAKLNGCDQLIGGLFAGEISVEGGAHVSRAIDDIPPHLEIVSPADGSSVTECEIEVSGFAGDDQTWIELGVNGSLVEVDADGSFVTMVSLWTDDPGLIEATATDAAGNTTTVSVRVTIILPEVDLTVPAPGSLVGERVIGLAGTSGTATVVTVNGVEAALAEGAWTISAFDLGEDDGLVSLNVVASNCGGATSETFVLDLDTEPPTIAITSPEDGSVSYSSTINVTGVASDAHLQKVVVNGVEATVSPDGSWIAANIVLDPGWTTITATAYDALNQNASVQIQVQLDTQPPVVTIDHPAADCLEAGQQQVIGGSFSDANPGSDPLRLQVHPAGEAMVEYPAALTSDTSWEATGISLGAIDGTASVTLLASDELGNSSQISRSWRIDASAPVVQLLLDGKPFPGTIDGEVPQGQPMLLNQIVAARVSVNDGPLGAPSAVMTLNGAPYIAGTPVTEEKTVYTLVATATDCAGLTTSVCAHFQLDMTAPELIATVPDDGTLVGDPVESYRGTADSELAAVWVNGVEAAVTGDGTGFEIQPFPWREGDNQVTIELRDAAGNQSSFVRSFLARTTEPTVEIRESGIEITEGSVFKRSMTPEIRSNFTDNTIEATLDGAAYTSGVEIADAGTHTITATATDPLGRSATGTVSFSIDLSDDPVISIASPVDGTRLSETTVTVTGTVTASEPIVKVNDLAATVNGSSFIVSGLELEPDVLNSITATVVDRAGRTAVDTITVLVQTGAPTVVILEPADGALTNRSRIDVAGVVIGGSDAVIGGTVKVGDTDVPVEADGEWRAYDVPLQEGANTIVAEALAMAESGTGEMVELVGQASISVTADLTPPGVVLEVDGQLLEEGATFSEPPVVEVEVTDTGSEALPPQVFLNGAQIATTEPKATVVISDDGGYLLSVVAEDAAGNQTRIERAFTVGVSACNMTGIEPADGSAVASASVTIRGQTTTARSVQVRAVSASDPQQYQEWPASLADGTFLAGDVPLADVGENRVDLVCTSAGGDESLVTLLLERLPDGSGPVVEITAPPTGELVATDSVTVQGTVSDPTATVTVNGIGATVEGTGLFSAAVPLAEGPSIIVARAVDAAGRAGRDRTVVWRDTQAPQVQITNPESNTWLGIADSGAAVEVTGIVDIDNEPNLSGVELRSEPSQSSVSVIPDPASGSFVATVGLDSTVGANTAQTITATASDVLDHQGKSSVTIYLDPTGPAIGLTEPADLSRYDENVTEITISGQAWGAEGTQVAINGTTLELTDEQWQDAGDGRLATSFTTTMTPPAEDGGFGVIAVATNLDGRTARDRRLLFRDSAPPTVVEMVPADGAIGVDRDSLLMVLFSEPVRHSGLTGSNGLTLTRHDTTDQVVGKVAVAGNAVAFVTGAALEPGVDYTFTAGSGITDLAGHPLDTTIPNQVTFTVAEASAGAAPVIDELQSVVCATELMVTGTTAPSSGVRVRDGQLGFSGYADAEGKFAIRVLLASSGFHLLHVYNVDTFGNQAGPEATAVVRVDCSSPTVTFASFDRSTGVISVDFSEVINITTVSIGGADDSIRLRDADAPPGTYESGTILTVASDSTIEIGLDTATDAWWRERPVRLEIGVPLADVNNNQMKDDYSTIFLPAGQGEVEGGFLFGEAYDDTTGRPLEGARVRLFASGAALPGTGATISSPVAEATTSERGRFNLVTSTSSGDIAAGRYVNVIEHDSYTRVVRRLALAPASGAVPFDSRLTPLAEPAGTIDPMTGGELAHQQQPLLTVEAQPGGVPGSETVTVRLTPLSNQGLIDFVPLGWTPVAAAELRLEVGETTLPEAPSTSFIGGGVLLQMPLPEWLLPTDQLIAVQYRLAAGVWLTLGEVERYDGAGGIPVARVAVPGPGTVALIKADEDDLTRPPIPAAAGEILLGVALPEVAPELLAEMTAEPGMIPVNGVATVRAVARSADQVTAWPAGMAVQAFLEERLHLASGEELVEAPFSADLLLYHPRLTSEEQGANTVGSSGAMELMVAPSERASQVLLDIGYENIRLYPFPEQVERGNILGPAGGSVTSPDGVELVLAEGALPAKTVVNASLIAEDELAGLPEITGYDTIAGIRLDLSGESLARPATLRLLQPGTTPAEIAGDPRLVLVELVEDPGDGLGSIAKLAARITRISEGEVARLEAAPEPADSLLVLDGIIHEGTYLVLAARGSIGFTNGFVRAANGAPLAASRVWVDSLGSGDISDDNGRYAAVVSVAAPALHARHPVLDEVGSATATGIGPGGIAVLDITVTPIPPEIDEINPIDGAINVTVGTGVSLVFSEPLDPTSVSELTLSLEIAGEYGGTGAYINGGVTLVSSTTVLFTPSVPLPQGRRLLAHFAGDVCDTGGTYYQGGPLTWSFTTLDSPVSGGDVDPSKFHVEMPAEDGTVRVFSSPGAVPGDGWAIEPYVKRELVDDPQVHTVTSYADGSFADVTLGLPPNQPVTISDEVWVKVFDPGDLLAEHFRLGPFTSADGLSFVVPAGEALIFTTPDGIGVEVPEGAFDEAKLVRVMPLDLSEVESLLPPDLGVAGFVEVDFDGVANQSLVLKVPAPADIDLDADVFVAAPVTVPWGRRLQMISIGGVIEENGQRYVSNHPSVQPEPPLDGSGKGLLDRPRAKGDSICENGLRTCEDYRHCCREYDEATANGGQACPVVAECCYKVRNVSTPRCFADALWAQISKRKSAIWFYEIGIQWAMMTGHAGSWAASVGASNYYFYNVMADHFYYIPDPVDWNGKYGYAVRHDEHVVNSVVDGSYGWELIREHITDSFSADGGFFVETGTLPGREPTPPMLVSSNFFAAYSFRTPRPGHPIELSRSILAETDQDENERLTGKVRVRAIERYPVEDDTWFGIWNMTKTLAAIAKNETPPPPTRGPELTIDGNGDSWELELTEEGKDFVLWMGRGKADAAKIAKIELNFDQPLEIDGEIDEVIRLRDHGISDERTVDGREIPVDIKLEARATRLVVIPLIQLSPGHSYSLEIAKPEAIKGTNGGLTYWPQAITKLEFATRRIGGRVAARTDEGQAAALHPDARDQVKLGNMVYVATADGYLKAIDVSDYSKPDGYRVHSTLGGSAKPIRALQVNEKFKLVYAAMLQGMTWSLKTFREEDILSTSKGGTFLPVLGGIKLGYGIGYYSASTAEDYLAAHKFPSGTPVDLNVLTIDKDSELSPLPEFYDTWGVTAKSKSFDDLVPDENGIYTFKVEITGDVTPVRQDACYGDPLWDVNQRVAVINKMTGESFVGEIYNGDGPGTVQLTVRASKEDMLLVSHNLAALGDLALQGGGIEKLDLGRGFGYIPNYTPAERRRQCGKFVGLYGGADAKFPPEANTYGNPPNGIELITSVASHMVTGGDEGVGKSMRGVGSSNMYGGVRSFGSVHARSPASQLGNISTVELTVIKELWLDRMTSSGEIKPKWMRVRCEDVVLANNVTWLDNGFRGSFVREENEDGVVINRIKFVDQNGPDAPPIEKTGDILFEALGARGIAVYDVSNRSKILIGHLFYNDHVIYRLQVDDTGQYLFAGGRDPVKGWVVDIWSIRAVNSKPDPMGDPQPLQTIYGLPWKTRNLAIDTDLTMMYSYTANGATTAIPYDMPRFTIHGLFLPEEDPENPVAKDGEVRPYITRITPNLVPLGTPLEETPELEEERSDENERKATAFFQVHAVLPGSFGPEVKVVVDTIREGVNVGDSHLGYKDIGNALAPPGGPAYPKNRQELTLYRVGHGGVQAGGRYGPAHHLYKSREVVAVLSDARAQMEYRRQKNEVAKAAGDDGDADEESQCLRCSYPSYLPDPETNTKTHPDLENIVELLAAGDVRVYLHEPEDGSTNPAIDYFNRQQHNFPRPFGYAKVIGPARSVAAPAQQAGVEPALNDATWSANEAGTSLQLISGDVVVSSLDLVAPGRKQVVAFERNYHSGSAPYGVLGSAGWHSPLFARLVEIPTIGFVLYYDGTGKVHTFLPRAQNQTTPPDGYTYDKMSSYFIPDGLYVRLQRLPGGAGWRMIDRFHTTVLFDASGYISEISDRHRRGKDDPDEQGNTTIFDRNPVHQVTSIRNEYGQEVLFEYYDDPYAADPNERKWYGLLKKVTHYAPNRSVKLTYTDDRALHKVELASVTNDYFADGKHDKPTIEYHYDPDDGVTKDDKSTTAILHGRFAGLRLAGFTLPGASEKRLLIKYEQDTGRAKEISFPSSVEGSTDRVAWKFAYDTSTAAPASEITVTSPWSFETKYALTDDGQIDTITLEDVETLAAGDVTPTADGELPEKTLVTNFDYEDDGRLDKVTRADGSIRDYTYADAEDPELELLARANVKEVKDLAGSAETGLASYNEINVKDLEYSEDNILRRYEDDRGREVVLPVSGPKAMGVPSGYTAEGVQGTSDYDAFGRGTAFSAVDGGAKEGEPGSQPMSFSLHYKEEPSNRAGAGYLERLTVGQTYSEEYGYDDAGNVTDIITSYGPSSHFRYDEWDRPIEEITGQGGGSYADASVKVQRAFDAAGHLIHEQRRQDPYGWVVTDFTYNEREQLKTVTLHNLAAEEPGGGAGATGTISYKYDAHGRLKEVINADKIKVKTVYSYDSLGRVSGVKVGEAGKMKQGYDEQGRLVWTTDGHNGVWRGVYDAWSRLWKEVLASGVQVERELDQAGAYVRETAYDGDGRVWKLSETVTELTSFGALERVEERILDHQGAQIDTLVTGYSYDSSGRLEEVRRGADHITGRREIRVTYDSANRVDTVVDAVGNLTDYTFRYGGPWPDRIDYHETGPNGGPGVSHSTDYESRDAFGRALIVTARGTTTSQRFDQAGNLLWIGQANNEIFSTYDGHGRLLSAQRPTINQLIEHGYDLDGRVKKSRVHREYGAAEDTSYTYDTAGRMKTRSRPGSLKEHFEYYGDSTLKVWKTRLANVTSKEPLTQTFSYDKANRLTKRMINVEAFGESDRPPGLAPVDYGDAFKWNKLGFPTSVAFKTGPNDADIDKSTRVRNQNYDSRGLSWVEKAAGATFSRSYDRYGRTEYVMLPQGLAADSQHYGYAFEHDDLDRMVEVRRAMDDGALDPVSSFGARYGWGGEARLWSVDTNGGLGIGHDFEYLQTGARLSMLTFTAGEQPNGSLIYQWNPATGLKDFRRPGGAPGSVSVVDAGQGWDWIHDDAFRLRTAISEIQNERTWTYGYGRADELLSISDTVNGFDTYVPGPEGRIKERTRGEDTVSFKHDAEGRRIEDDRFKYLYTWRGHLVQVDVKADAPAHAGERVVYTYEATGRLLKRTHYSAVPEGGTDDDRSFISARRFIWDGETLAAEAGLNHQGEVIWRKQYVPGPTGLDDAPQVRIETGLNGGTPTEALYAFVRDEMGSVIAVFEDAEPAAGEPPALLARYLYTPYGEAMIEHGPKLTQIDFDGDVTQVDGESQDPPVSGVSVAGAVRIETTSPLAPATYASGLSVEQWSAEQSSWIAVDPAEVVVAPSDSNPAQLMIMRRAGWVKEDRFRIMLGPGLTDANKRQIQLPQTEAGGVEVMVQVPDDGLTPPDCTRVFEAGFDSVEAAGDWLGGAFPGGQTALFQGLWTDPVTGISYARNRWYDARNASWLSQDSYGAIDSVNLYAFVAWGPSSNIDPRGLTVVLGKEKETAEEIVSEFSNNNEIDRDDLKALYDKKRKKYIMVASSPEALERLRDSGQIGMAIAEWIVSDKELRFEWGDVPLARKRGGGICEYREHEWGAKILIDTTDKSYSYNKSGVTQTTASILAHELGHSLFTLHPELREQARRYEWGNLSYTSAYFQGNIEPEIRGGECFAMMLENYYRERNSMNEREVYEVGQARWVGKPDEISNRLWNPDVERINSYISSQRAFSEWLWQNHVNTIKHNLYYKFEVGKDGRMRYILRSPEEIERIKKFYKIK
jgi:RHS repeat-associated protein